MYDEAEGSTPQEKINSIRREMYLNKKKSASQLQTGGKVVGGHHYITTPDDPIRDKKAAEAYDKYARENDAKRIADNTGFSERDIVEIRRYIFFNKHQLYDGYGRFPQDYDMAVAWKRLREGNFEPRDITLLRHELLESRLEKEYNLTIAEAHKLANEQYDWWEQLVNEIGEGGEPDGLL